MRFALSRRCGDRLICELHDPPMRVLEPRRRPRARAASLRRSAEEAPNDHRRLRALAFHFWARGERPFEGHIDGRARRLRRAAISLLHLQEVALHRNRIRLPARAVRETGGVGEVDHLARELFPTAPAEGDSGRASSANASARRVKRSKDSDHGSSHSLLALNRGVQRRLSITFAPPIQQKHPHSRHALGGDDSHATDADLE